MVLPFDKEVLLKSAKKTLADFYHDSLDTKQLIIAPYVEGMMHTRLLNRECERIKVFEEGDETLFVTDNKEKIKLPMRVGLWYKSIMSCGDIDETRLLHARLGHPGRDLMAEIKDLSIKVAGIELKDEKKEMLKKLYNCSICLTAVMRRPFYKNIKADWSEAGICQYIQVDVFFYNSETVGYDGSVCTVGFLCVKTGHDWLYNMRDKGDAYNKLKKFVTEIRQLGLNDGSKIDFIISEMKTDSGGEFMSEYWNERCGEYGIFHKIKPHPEHLAYREARFGALRDRTRCLMAQSVVPRDLQQEAIAEYAPVPDEMWPLAVLHANFLMNTCYPRRKHGGKTSHEIIYKTAFDTSNIKIWWSPIFSYIDEKTRKHHESRGMYGRFAGINIARNSYIIYSAEHNATYYRGYMMCKVVENMQAVKKDMLKNIREEDVFDDHEYRRVTAEAKDFAVSKTYLKATGELIRAVEAVTFSEPTSEENAFDGRWYGIIKIEHKNKFKWFFLCDYLKNTKNYGAYVKFINENGTNGYYPLLAEVVIEARGRYPRGVITGCTPENETGTRKLCMQVFYPDGKTKDINMNAIEEIAREYVYQYATTTEEEFVPLGDAQPKVYDQAVRRGLVKHIEAGKKEMRQLRELKVYSPIWWEQIPEDENIIPMALLLKEKILAGSGLLDKIKGRGVALGNFEIDPEDGFAPVVHWQSIMMQLIYNLNAEMNMVLVDVVGAYLRADLKKPVYIRFPKGFTENGTSYAVLHKSLYGLHESGANFYEMLTKAMLEIKKYSEK